MARELQCHGHSHKGIAEPELSHNTMFYNEVFANLMALVVGWSETPPQASKNGGVCTPPYA
jgi:hypothetical protein